MGQVFSNALAVSDSWTPPLEDHIQNATMPRLQLAGDAPEPPPSGSRSHRNALCLSETTMRKLSCTHYIIPHVWVRLNREFISDCFRSSSIKSDTDAGQLFAPSSHSSRPHVDVHSGVMTELCSWVEQVPLEIAMRVMHASFGEARGSSIHAGRQCKDGDVFRYFTMRRGEGDFEQHLMLVAVQPSWILTPQDFDDFVGCRAFPLKRPENNSHKPEETDAFATSRRLRCKERIWAKLWDVCSRLECRYFAITTYDRWAFGGFSAGWTTGFISPVRSSDELEPSIMQSLVFWMAVSFGVPGTYQIPFVPSETDGIFYGDLPPHPEMESVPRSPSWNSSATLWKLSTDAGTLIECPPVYDPEMERAVHLQPWTLPPRPLPNRPDGPVPIHIPIIIAPRTPCKEAADVLFNAPPASRSHAALEKTPGYYGRSSLPVSPDSNNEKDAALPGAWPESPVIAEPQTPCDVLAARIHEWRAGVPIPTPLPPGKRREPEPGYTPPRPPPRPPTPAKVATLPATTRRAEASTEEPSSKRARTTAGKMVHLEPPVPPRRPEVDLHKRVVATAQKRAAKNRRKPPTYPRSPDTSTSPVSPGCLAQVPRTRPDAMPHLKDSLAYPLSSDTGAILYSSPSPISSLSSSASPSSTSLPVRSRPRAQRSELRRQPPRASKARRPATQDAAEPPPTCSRGRILRPRAEGASRRPTRTVSSAGLEQY